jgi:hypothetical protein
MLVRTGDRTRRSSKGKPVNADNGEMGRLTIYTSPQTEFAVRYLALIRRQSVSKLLGEQVEALLKKEGIDPQKLPGIMPKSKE